MSLRKYGRLEVAGWALYLVSWITPSLDGRQLGARAFVLAVDWGTSLVFHAASAARVLIGVCLLFGWLANFSILLRWSRTMRWVWMAAPWFPFVAILLAHPMSSPATLLYFYPWAIGIALIHAGRSAVR